MTLNHLTMRKLKIQLIDKENRPLETITAVKFDSTKEITIISLCNGTCEKNVIRLLDRIDHWNIFAGMVTVYYKSGCLIEITRIND